MFKQNKATDSSSNVVYGKFMDKEGSKSFEKKKEIEDDRAAHDSDETNQETQREEISNDGSMT